MVGEIIGILVPARWVSGYYKDVAVGSYPSEFVLIQDLCRLALLLRILFPFNIAIPVFQFL